jgi:hypothetical protein
VKFFVVVVKLFGDECGGLWWWKEVVKNWLWWFELVRGEREGCYGGERRWLKVEEVS